MSSEEPKGPPVLQRPGTFAGQGVGREAEVTPEAAIAAGLRLVGTLGDSGAQGASAVRLAYLAAANQATGRLDLHGEVRFSVAFRKGTPEGVSSSDPADGIGPFLARKGLVRPDQLAEAELAAGRFGGDLVSSLAAQKAIDPARSFPALQEHAVGLFGRALAVEKGGFTWEPSAPAFPSSFALGPRFGMISDAVRRLDGLTLRRRLAPRMGQAPARVGGRVELPELKLTAQEVRLAAQLDGGRALSELVQAAGAEADAVLRVTLLLAETDLLAFGAPRAAPPAPAASAPDASAPPAAGVAPAASQTQPAPAPRAPAAAPRPPPAAARAPVAPRPSGPGPSRPESTPAPSVATPPSDVPSMRAALERIQKADHFEALGLKHEAASAVIKATYFALAKAWHPDAGPPDEPAEGKRLRADLFARIGEAWAVLGDEAQRKQYLDDLKTGAASTVDVSAIFEAEDLFQRAQVLERTRQYPLALQELDKAIQLNDKEPEFHVLRAWVRFLVAQDRKAQLPRSAGEIEAALKELPNCKSGHLFLGRMAKVVGDLGLAEKYLKRGLQVVPDDPELQRELRYLRK